MSTAISCFNDPKFADVHDAIAAEHARIECERFREIADEEARAESPLYRLAATIHGHAERAGLRVTGETFDERCDHEKEFLGRVIQVLRDAAERK